MVQVAVAPLDDGTDMRRSWQVLKGGMQQSTHTKKSAAKRKARQIASSGDELVIKGTGGAIQSKNTVR